MANWLEFWILELHLGEISLFPAMAAASSRNISLSNGSVRLLDDQIKVERYHFFQVYQWLYYSRCMVK